MVWNILAEDCLFEMRYVLPNDQTCLEYHQIDDFRNRNREAQCTEFDDYVDFLFLT